MSTVVGEMSLITERRTQATVIALTECELRLLTRAQLRRLIDSDSLAAYKAVVSIPPGSAFPVSTPRVMPPARAPPSRRRAG